MYQKPRHFLAEAFGDEIPEPRFLWVTSELKPRIKRIMGHRLGVLRVRYWGRGRRTAWILEEIGKYKPITTGIVVDGDRIERLKVLVYRESHGWEVRYPFFTNQFKSATLAPGLRLDRHIDGISGATLSVNALTRLAKLALFFHARTPHAQR